MPDVTGTLDVEIPPGREFTIVEPRLRPGDVIPDTGTFALDGVLQDPATFEFRVDFTYMRIGAANLGPATWPVGAVAVIGWQGVMIEPLVLDHETRIRQLETGGGTGDTAALEARVTALESTTETHDYQLIGHEQRISQNTSKLTALEARVAALEAG